MVSLEGGGWKSTCSCSCVWVLKGLRMQGASPWRALHTGLLGQETWGPGPWVIVLKGSPSAFLFGGAF